jgi:hypothetical protein
MHGVHHEEALPLLDPDELRPGDVVLTRARRHLSRLMAWNAECPYSHASLVVSRRRVVDAYPPYVRLRPLRALLAEALDVADVYRPVAAWRRPLPRADRRRIVRTALACLGRPYAGLRLPGLAVRTLLQHKLGWALAARAPRAAGAMICTEVVYRALRSGLPLQLGDRRRQRQSFPRLHWRHLWREMLGFWRDWCRHPDRPLREAALRGLPPIRDIDAGSLITTDLCSSPSLRLLGRIRCSAAEGEPGARIHLCHALQAK